MKIDIGSGFHKRPGFLCIDRKDGGEAFPLKLSDGSAVPDGSVDEAVASHVLEHFGHHESLNVVKEWARTLKPGGVLKVAVPDAHYCIDAYNTGKKTPHPIEAYLFGGQQDGDDFHKAMFNRGKLEALLKAAGLEDIKPWVSDRDDCAAMEVSLNLQGTKPGAVEAQPVAPTSEQPREIMSAAEFLNANLFGRYAANTYSQNGEDGILAEIFRRIGTTTRHCFEVGADDGLRFSNTRKLIEQGWTSHQIEADEGRFTKLRERYKDKPGVRCVRAVIDDQAESTLDAILESTSAPAEPDLGVIDIDGQDYYQFLGMVRHRPRVMVVEFDHTNDDLHFIPERGGNGQAGMYAISDVGLAKGYCPVARTLCNIVFVRRELVEKLTAEPFREAAPPPKVTAHMELATELPGVAAVLSMPRYAFTQQVACLLELAQKMRVPCYIRQGVFWHSTLEAAIDLALQTGAEFVLTVDIDTIFKIDHVAELYRLLKANPKASAICGTQVGRDRDDVLLTIRDAADPTRNARQIDRALYDADVMPIATGHFGLTIIRASVFKALAKPWFNNIPAPDGSWGEGRIDADIYFWREMEKAGLKLYQANKVRLGHWQDVVTLPDDNLQPIHVYSPDFRAGRIPAAVKW